MSDDRARQLNRDQFGGRRPRGPRDCPPETQFHPASLETGWGTESNPEAARAAYARVPVGQQHPPVDVRRVR